MSARKTAITCASAAALAICVPAVQKYEGYAPTVVPDRLAGGLPTGGYGETVGVKLGETHDKAYWSARLATRLADDYDAGIGKCIHVELPDGVRAMAISDAYNAGVGAVCSSPMVAKWNAGDVEGGCNAIKGWRIASRPRGPGTPLVVQRGLVIRRNDEAAKCLAYARGELKPPAVILPVEHPAELPCSGSGQGPIDCPRNAAPPDAPKPKPAPVKPAAVAAKPSAWCWLFKCGGKA